MARFYHGDHVRPSSPATGLPRRSVRDTWVAVDDAEGFMTDPVCLDPGLFLRDVLDGSARAAATTASANAVGPWADAVAAADSMVVSAEQKLVDAKEQARKQRAVAAQKAKEQAKAEREAKANAEVKAKRDALLLRLQAAERLADATKALILEVQGLVKYATPERIAPQEVFQHVNQLDALAKSYGYKIVRAGSRCIVAKA